MSDVHGVIICSGNGTRYAKSVGGEIPYPKHLEMIGGESVLERSAKSLIDNLGVTDITFILNPALAEQYIGHLSEVQSHHSEVPFQYAISNEFFEDSKRRTIQMAIREGVYTLNAEQIDFGDPILAICDGDLILNIQESEAMKKDLEGRMTELEADAELMIVTGGPWSGTLYWLGKLNSLTDLFNHEDGIHLRGEYMGWNINTVTDLILAKRDLGIKLTLTEQESIRFISFFGKEG